jgi:hypothetical protein
MASADEPDDVLSRLPRNRPARRSARRGPASADGEAPAKPASRAKPKAAASSAAKPRARAKPKAAAKPAARAKPKAAASPPPRPAAAPPRPEPEPVPRSARRPIEPPSGTEILQSAVQAAGDLAAVGITVGREALKAVVSRLPRP